MSPLHSPPLPPSATLIARRSERHGFKAFGEDLQGRCAAGTEDARHAREGAAAIARAIAVEIPEGDRRTRGARTGSPSRPPAAAPKPPVKPRAARVSVPPIAPRQDIRPAPGPDARPKPR